jgi:hypothetical protein
LRQRTIRGSMRQQFDGSRQPAMTAVAEWRVLGMLAAAPRDGFGLGDLHFLRREAGAFVRAVAERLAFGLAAAAPVISAGFNFLNNGRFLRNFWFAHKLLFLTRLFALGNSFQFNSDNKAKF